jgi:fatty acid desaturase
MPGDTTLQGTRASPIGMDELRRLQLRSNARGLQRLAGHLAAIGGSGWLYAFVLAHSTSHWFALPPLVLYGFTLVTMFATMHEAVHRTAFRSRRLNDGVAWFAGLLSFYNSTFYRHYHGWHHRFTQIIDKDPELEDVKPTSVLGYIVQMSGVPWWIGKLRTHFKVASGQIAGYGFLNAKTGPSTVRSVRLQLVVYALGIALSIALRRPWFVTYWFLPVAAAQPLLRAILLAEHGDCSHEDDALSNTRTTYTIFLVRFLMWEMPYHAEHHRYPALPFFVLARAHENIGPHLTHIARQGYRGMHVQFLRGLNRSARRTPTP